MKKPRVRGERVVLCVQNLSVPEDRRVWREARTLHEAGYTVSVICPRGKHRAARECLDGIDIRRYRLPADLSGFAGLLVETAVTLVRTGAILARLRMGGRIAVLHAANPPDTYFLLAAPLRRGGTRFVYDQHDLCPELLDARMAPNSAPWIPLARILHVLERLSYRCADLVIAPNNSYRRVAMTRGGVVPQRVVVVRSGPDEFRPPAVKPEQGPLVVAFAGVMGRQDCVDILLQAVAKVTQRRPGLLRVDLIGEGDDVPRLQAMCQELGLDGVVSWAGWLTGERLNRRLGAADIAVSLDDDSPFSRLSTMTKVPEYLGLGLPCVVADLPENRVTAGDAAAYFEPGNPDDLSKRLEELVDHPSVRDQLRRAAITRAPYLLWEHSGSRLVAAYDCLLGGEATVAGDQELPE